MLMSPHHSEGSMAVLAAIPVKNTALPATALITT